MKKIILFLIPIFLVAIIVYATLKIFVLGELGKGALQVTSKPFSKVYLNNAYIGSTPLCLCEGKNMLRSGEYTIKMEPINSKASGYSDKVTITKGVLTVVDRRFGTGATSEGSIISLEEIEDKQTSQLLVVTFPDSAEIFVDSNYEGTSPFFKDSITDSDHTLRIKKDGYNDKNVRIRTPAGYKLTAVIYLGLPGSALNPLLLSPTPVATTSATPSISSNKKTQVAILQTPNGFLRVRAEPTINAQEISRITPGSTFPLLEELAGWYKIRLKDDTVGWISSQYASKQN